MKKILCYIYDGMADFEISLLLHRLKNTCKYDIVSVSESLDPFYRPNYVEARTVTDRNLITAKGYAFVDFAASVCDYLDIFENEQQKYEQLGQVKE